MKKKWIIIGIIVFIVVIALAVIIDNSRKVEFEDETMAEMIAKTVGMESAEELRVDDLEMITTLNVGYTGYYNTLLDMEKCPNLQRLFINCPEDVMSYYPFVGREIPEPESEERVEQIEKELGDVLGQCSKLEDIYISNKKGNCKLDNIEFLKKRKSLKVICLFYQSDIDYAPISECKELVVLALRQCDVSDLSMLDELENLELLYLDGTNISDVEELLKLKNLKNLEIVITDTPLAEKTEELENLQQQFPGLVIKTD